MTRRAVCFTGPESVEVRTEPVPEPGAEEVLVRTERSGVSPGTEMLLYRNEVPSEMRADETIEALEGTFSYPLRYGYAAVGRIAAVGEAVGEEWLDRRVFAFNPHESHFVADPTALIPIALAPERAIFVPSVETAINLVMDARPRIGARVVVFGQGPVGLLTTAVLSAFPLAELITVERLESRRALSESFGADRSVRPSELEAALADASGDGADITIELSGNPTALDDAVDATGYAGQVIVGSWYGTKDVTLDLGETYHRSHLRMRSSQVSRIDPDHAGRWDKDRRMDLVRSWLRENDPTAMLTHEFGVESAADAYRLLEERPDEAVQIAFDYR
ncbi:oxidoreductase (homolog to zinc-containing alcohol dehydrogenase / threonine 3-dehydrogenase) [Natronomonas moolapensis 8.8.11]|uniref:Oxidoreductase (Homolog to zinc-containing alcohol dehydrogenase / threonine 3-dehydrogenase) n=1 Tax=Natronomonas moolapensis (strain DSM 18674 / CECT 7526 / JCM 14361 / 8.8.11) TaxID=268739 RepID=M1XZE7_NATM8|nr:zinc-binding alcohol dehydrogenase [Natronomonas moolapensis]CCQ35536.1 oxidoreductase (homolog to zinc-containing alcohol dehydrogenase / threonine 3-dehydrogenase) [Natronomonas moolapensis 8.8.11]